MLEKEKLLEIKGGVSSGILFIGVMFAVSFVAGFLDGLTRPFKCR